VEVYAAIRKSTLHFFTTSPTAGLLKGTLWFRGGLTLRVVEVVDFAVGEIEEIERELLALSEGERVY
jgi:hypothetical protein